MKIKIKHDEITEKVILNFTIEKEEYSEFKEHNIPKDTLPNNFNIGLIVGKSGSGKTNLLKSFGSEKTITWDTHKAIVSHFNSYEEAEERLLASGIASIPTWLKPYSVLSNGEKHRAVISRIISSDLVIDEFVSYVDDNAAMGLANNIQRYIRKKNYKNVVFASLNKNLIEYLQPDWVYDTDTRTLTVNSEIFDIESMSPLKYQKRNHFMVIK